MAGPSGPVEMGGMEMIAVETSLDQIEAGTVITMMMMMNIIIINEK